MAFSLAVNLSSPSVISFNVDITFAADGDKIHLLISEVLLRAAASDLARSKKQRYWTSRNAVLLPPFLTEAAIFHGESDAGKPSRFLTAPSRSGVGVKWYLWLA